MVLFIGGLIVGWTSFSSRLNAVEVQAQENKTVLQAIYLIQTDIAVMKNDIAIIKLKIR